MTSSLERTAWHSGFAVSNGIRDSPSFAGPDGRGRRRGAGAVALCTDGSEHKRIEVAGSILAEHVQENPQSAARAVRAPDPRGSRSTTVLLTGATGRIGSVVLADLLERGYCVRATTSRGETATDDYAGALEWRQFDLLRAPQSDYAQLVTGCQAVLHLAAEIHAMDRMSRVNVDGTRLLAEASERAGVGAFCYTSSIFVYGSGRRRTMTEDAPVLTVDRDVPSEYLAPDNVRAYGRTKLAGERALREAAKSVRYVVLRPAVVVDIAQMVEILNWSKAKQVLVAHRHAHQVYVRDVSDAIIWSMERALRGAEEPGSVATYNVSEDEYVQPTHADFLREALRATGDPRFRVTPAPAVVDRIYHAIRFRSLSTRNALWRMRFPNDTLRQAGWCPPFGMAYARALAIAQLRGETGVEIPEVVEWDSRNS